VSKSIEFSPFRGRPASCIFSSPDRAAFAALEESKVVSSRLLMVHLRQILRIVFFALLFPVSFVVLECSAYGQSFALSLSSPLSPPAVDPGGSAIASFDLTASGGFDSAVSFSCAVTSSQVTTNLPTCLVSPTSATPPANGPSLTVSTTAATLAGTYQITVTAASGATSLPITVTLQVQPVSENYVLSALPTTATPSPVAAGSSATTVVTVTPIASYTGTVTLACLSITPAVTPAPICSFTPPSVSVSPNSAAQPSTLTIETSGPAPTSNLKSPRVFYPAWLALPGLVLLSTSAAGAMKRNVLGILLLLALAGALLLLPACSSSNSATRTTNNGITPTNTYTFTLTGVDTTGAGPSTTTPTTVTLMVN
jgi:hypothetical protein